MVIKCPRCEKDLMNVDKNGISVDVCPKCKGVWLDETELDEIISNSTGLFDKRPKIEKTTIPDEEEFIEEVLGLEGDEDKD
jgi:uncharacterized protein